MTSSKKNQNSKSSNKNSITCYETNGVRLNRDKVSCSICLSNIKSKKCGPCDLSCSRNINTTSAIVNEQDNYITLKCCNTTFHSTCLKKWALRDNPDACLDCHMPVKNRPIYFYEDDKNMFSCPVCRTKYCHDVRSDEIRKVLARVCVLHKDKTLYSNITDMSDLTRFSPLSQFENHRMKAAWAGNLSFIKNAWDEGYFDIYAMIKSTPNSKDKFFLTIDQNKKKQSKDQMSPMLIPPFDETTGMFMDRNKIAMDKLLAPALYEQVEMDNLAALLNDGPMP